MDCVRNGANMEELDANGGTPIMFAVSCGFEDGVSALIKLGANIDHRDRHGNTAAIYAISNNRQGCFRKLIEAGANLNIQSNDGHTALMVAAKFYPEWIEYMVAAGADPDLADKFGYTPAMFALGSGNKQGLINLAMSGANLTATNIHGYTLMDMASTTSVAPMWMPLIAELIFSARERKILREQIQCSSGQGDVGHSIRL